MAKYQYEILLLLDWGYKPKEIIAMGYNKKTVYKWSSTYKWTLSTALRKVGTDEVKIIKKLKSLWLGMIRRKQEK